MRGARVAPWGTGAAGRVTRKRTPRGMLRFPTYIYNMYKYVQVQVLTQKRGRAGSAAHTRNASHSAKPA